MSDQDRIVTRPDGTGTASMFSISLGRVIAFDLTHPPGASATDIAHAAALKLLREEQNEIGE